jgi:hypothetical protein
MYYRRIDDGVFEVDLYLQTTLPDMIYLYRGDLPLARALEQERLEAHGVGWARCALSRWLARSSLAHVKPQTVARGRQILGDRP